ncbi:hypothetical protein O0L34_g1597 [Tuta absoluta]|nr:hypothetical protein O0L34_g1597 [Tuta absoluta]
MLMANPIPKHMWTFLEQKGLSTKPQNKYRFARAQHLQASRSWLVLVGWVVLVRHSAPNLRARRPRACRVACSAARARTNATAHPVRTSELYGLFNCAMCYAVCSVIALKGSD